VPLDECVPLSRLEILAHHLAHKCFERYFRCPAQLAPCLAGIAEEGFDLRRAEVTGVDAYDRLAFLERAHRTAVDSAHDAHFLDAFPAPGQGDAKFPCRRVDEVPYAVLPARGDDEVLGSFLLQHPPLGLNVVLGVAPVALGVEVAEVDAVLQPQVDAGQCASDLARDEGLAPHGRFVIEKNAIASVEAIGLSVVDGDPVGIELGDRIGRAGVKGGRLPLRDLLYLAVELRRRGLVVAGLFLQPQDADSLEQPQRSKGIGVSGVLGFLEGHGDMALRREIVNFVGLYGLHDPDQAARIGHVTVVQDELPAPHVRVLVQVIDSIRVEERGAALDAVDLVAFPQEELGEVGAILAGDARN